MTTQQIALVVLLVVLVAAIALRRVGPRVTQIDRTVHRKKKGEQ